MSSASWSTEGLERLRRSLAGYVEQGERPGLVSLVGRGDEVHVDALGVLGFGDARPMRRDTIFRIASLTKPVVAAAALILVQEGRLALDEPIDRLLPELAERRVLRRLDGPLDDTVPARRPILVRHLLTLTMGMGAIMQRGRFPLSEALSERGLFVPFRMPTQASADEWLASLGQLPLMDQPGEVWRYDTSLTVLGALLERATGQQLHDLLRERLFEPLGMTDTGFFVPKEQLARLPVAYQRTPASGALDVWDPSGEHSFFARRPGFAGAHGGLVSTADDLLAFARLLLAGGRARGRQVIAEALVAQMQSEQVPEDVKSRSLFVPGFWEHQGWGYGLSIRHGVQPGEPRGCGWFGGYGTCAYWDRESGVTAILLSQRLVEGPSASQIYTDFFDGAYAAAGL